MPNTFRTRLKKFFSVFSKSNDEPIMNGSNLYSYGVGDYINPGVYEVSAKNKKSIANTVFTRIALDAASITLKHVRVDQNENYKETINSDFNDCLNYSANVDQTGRELLQDIVLSMLDEGSVAVVPVSTDQNLLLTDSYKIYELRVGKIVQWFPSYVCVELYNENTGKKQEVYMPKNKVAIIQNPFYSIINERNSTMQRLVRKMSLLDVSDENVANNKLNIIVQLPYVIRTEAQRDQAIKRRKEIEQQLTDSKYGVVYTDGTERITQINRAAENNLFEQVKDLKSEFFGQLGITDSILNGEASEDLLNNYFGRIIEPIVQVIVDEYNRKFISATARSQGQAVMGFRNSLKLMPLSKLAEVTDKLMSNEVISSNEIRQVIGMRPSSDPRADQLLNKKLSQSSEEIKSQNGDNGSTPVPVSSSSIESQSLFDSMLDSVSTIEDNPEFIEVNNENKMLDLLSLEIDNIMEQYGIKGGDVS